MKFYLIKENEVEFSAYTIEVNHYIRNVKLQADLQYDGNGEDLLSERDGKILRNLLETNFENGKAPLKTLPDGPNGNQQDLEDTLEPLDWTLCVTVGMIGNNANNRDFIRVTGEEKGNILERLKHVLSTRGLILNLEVEVKNLTSILTSDNSTYMIDFMRTKEVDISELSATDTNCQGARLYTSGYFEKDYWMNTSYQYKGVISIICSVNQKQESIFTFPSQSQTRINKKILEEEINTDVTIITKDGQSVKCHKCHLSVYSPVLEEKFKSSSEEPKMSTVEMEMSEPSLKAFLAYLYYSEVEKATEKCAITLELFQAGLDYNIPTLESLMRNALLTKPDNWYDVEVALKLFLFARDLDDDDGAELKMRAVKLLKLNHSSLQNSTSYDQLFKENPVAAKELCQRAFSL